MGVICVFVCELQRKKERALSKREREKERESVCDRETARRGRSVGNVIKDNEQKATWNRFIPSETDDDQSAVSGFTQH